jgi:hypothetical protein
MRKRQCIFCTSLNAKSCMIGSEINTFKIVYAANLLVL